MCGATGKLELDDFVDYFVPFFSRVRLLRDSKAGNLRPVTITLLGVAGVHRWQPWLDQVWVRDHPNPMSPVQSNSDKSRNDESNQPSHREAFLLEPCTGTGNTVTGAIRCLWSLSGSVLPDDNSLRMQRDARSRCWLGVAHFVNRF